MKTTHVSLCSLIFLVISLFLHRGNSHRDAVLDTDLLVYSVFDYDIGNTLYLYDTINNESQILYQDEGRIRFEFSPNGLVVFSTDWIWENNGELFVLDTGEGESGYPLVNLSQEINKLGYPLGWSDDGNYLAFASKIDEGQQQAIYIWNGTTTTDITPQNTLGIPQGFDIAWSPEGHLAFTIWFGSSNSDPRSEIYIWNGKTTTNLSQNMNAEDREPLWNANGELVFGSILDNDIVLSLWDGISYDNGLPDITTFARVAPQLDIFSPFTVWIGDDVLAFEALDSQDAYIQIYEWNGQTWSNISQISDTNSYTPQWSQSGHWTFVTGQEHLYIRDADYNTVFETDGQSPAWSSNGSLIFCRRNDRNDWKLSRWDHASVSTLTQGDVIYAQWRSGQSAICSDG